ncbi:MAG: hypothetical protein JSW73_00525, partial [Candidatus Woesearchaeota archaeon]
MKSKKLPKVEESYRKYLKYGAVGYIFLIGNLVWSYFGGSETPIYLLIINQTLFILYSTSLFLSVRRYMQIRKKQFAIAEGLIKSHGSACPDVGLYCYSCFLPEECHLSQYKRYMAPLKREYIDDTKNRVYKEAVEFYLRKYKKEDLLE